MEFARQVHLERSDLHLVSEWKLKCHKTELKSTYLACFVVGQDLLRATSQLMRDQQTL